MLHSLNINYTLTVLPDNQYFCEHTSVMALTDVCKFQTFIFRLVHHTCAWSSVVLFFQLLQSSMWSVRSLASASNWTTGLLTTCGRSVSTQTCWQQSWQPSTATSWATTARVCCSRCRSSLMATSTRWDETQWKHRLLCLNMEISNWAACVLQDVTLNGFFGTFEIHMRDHETSEVQSSTTKTCPFSTAEFISKIFLFFAVTAGLVSI